MKAYRVLALLVAAGVVLQAGLIALGWFTVLNDVDSGGVFSKDSDWEGGLLGHSIVGMTVMPALAIVLLVMSLFTKTVGATKRAAIVFGAVALQIVLALAAFGIPAIGALHGMNAIAVLAAALYASRLPRSAGAAAQAAPRETTAV